MSPAQRAHPADDDTLRRLFEHASANHHAAPAEPIASPLTLVCVLLRCALPPAANAHASFRIEEVYDSSQKLFPNPIPS